MSQKYNANLTGEPFLLYEMKIVSDLMIQGLSKDEIKSKTISENLFQYKTLKSIPKRLSCVLRRLESLDSFLLSKLAIGDIDDQKIITLYAIYKDSNFVYDFLNELVREKLQLNQKELKDSEMMSYFNSKAREHVEMNSWSESSLKKIRQILKNILSGAGIYNKKRLVTPGISFQLREYLLSNGEMNFISNLGLSYDFNG